MNPACILAEFARAEKAARAARLLCESDLPEDAVSRSYYAVLHAAKAALLAHEIIAESHAAIRRLFGKILVKPGIFEAKWAAIFSDQQNRRASADYDVQITWESGEVQRLIEDAEAFVHRIRTYLMSRGFVEDEPGEPESSMQEPNEPGK